AVELQAAGEAHPLQRGPEDAVADLVDRGHRLGLRVGEADGVVEPAGDADEDELVHRGGDDEPAVLAGIGRKVASSAPQREAHRRAGNDHLDVRKWCSRSARPAGEPISKNLSWTTSARKRRRVASSSWTRSNPRATPEGSASTTSRRSAVAP